MTSCSLKALHIPKSAQQIGRSRWSNSKGSMVDVRPSRLGPLGQSVWSKHCVEAKGKRESLLRPLQSFSRSIQSPFSKNRPLLGSHLLPSFASERRRAHDLDERLCFPFSHVQNMIYNCQVRELRQQVSYVANPPILLQYRLLFKRRRVSSQCGVSDKQWFTIDASS